jgi:stage II sporulation protein E
MGNQAAASGTVVSTMSKVRKAKLRTFRAKLMILARELVLVAVAVLLGKANIGHEIAPFAFAFFVVVTEAGGKRQKTLAFAAVIGAFWRGGITAAATTLIAFLLYRGIRLLFSGKRQLDIHFIPFVAGVIDIAVRLAVIGTVWTRYDILMSLSDGALVIILALVFIQSLPLLMGHERPRTLRPEELMSLTILVGSVISGLNGLYVHQVSVMSVVVDWVILVLASAGGPGVGAAAAITVGILSVLARGETLAEVAVLGFAGLLSGVMKEGRRVWMGLAFLLSVVLLSAGVQTNWTTAWPVWAAALAGAAFFVATPRSLRTELAAYMPGTVEHQVSEQARVRRIRSLLSERMQDLGLVFNELSRTYAEGADSPLVSAQQLLDHTVASTATSVCQGCARRVKCWEKEGYSTYQAVTHTIERLEASPSGNVLPSPDLKERCIRIDAMMNTLRHQLEITDRDAKWMEKLREQNDLISAQLTGVAHVIESVAREIDRGNSRSLAGEEQILSALEQLGLYVDHVHIVSLEPGKVEIEITQPSIGAYENSVRMIAPLLSGIVGETISVRQVDNPEHGGPCVSVFTSARAYEVSTAVATAARDGKTVSGDSYSAVDLGNGRFSVVVSDGMGNGERARRESKAAVELLKQLLKAGFDEKLAIQTVNSTLLLRSRDEMFTTLDMALIDLYSAETQLLKVGSAPSYIKRGKSVRAISGASIPIGILRDIEVHAIEEQFHDGDLLILMSDGVYDAPNQLYDKDDWLRRQISRMETDDPQSIADTLLEAAVRLNHGEIHDDMTVLVARIAAKKPEWASIKLPGVTGLRHRSKGA